MGEELRKRNTDCVYFLASPLTCKKVRFSCLNNLTPFYSSSIFFSLSVFLLLEFLLDMLSTVLVASGRENLDCGYLILSRV